MSLTPVTVGKYEGVSIFSRTREVFGFGHEKQQHNIQVVFGFLQSVQHCSPTFATPGECS
jgi:hypothetical protein